MDDKKQTNHKIGSMRVFTGFGCLLLNREYKTDYENKKLPLWKQETGNRKQKTVSHENKKTRLLYLFSRAFLLSLSSAINCTFLTPKRRWSMPTVCMQFT